MSTGQESNPPEVPVTPDESSLQFDTSAEVSPSASEVAILGIHSEDDPVDEFAVEDSIDERVDFRVLNFESVMYDLADLSPQVHLQEADAPYRYLVIPVALVDAQAIFNAHAHNVGRRPSTHELLCAYLARTQADVIAARITRFEGGVFYAELDVMTPTGREVFDCRSSDALAIALRQRVAAPILCAESVLQAYYR